MKKLRVAIAGLGVVGKGVYEILTQDDLTFTEREIELVAVSSRSKKDFIDTNKVTFFSDPLLMAESQNVDLVIELIGGSEGIAYDLAKKSLSSNKHYVTANKALIAIHGEELANLAEKNNLLLLFESSVAGSIPVIGSLIDGLSANEFTDLYAILNGTSNFILTKMKENNSSFEKELEKAQRLGYAESNATFDVDGIDSAHKLAILNSIINKSKLNYESINITGIRNILSEDIKYAFNLGYKIKLLAKSIKRNNKLSLIVAPFLIKKDKIIANVDYSYNAIMVNGSNSGWNFQIGKGAGSKPTASAVVSDLIYIANCNRRNPFKERVKKLKNIETDCRLVNYSYFLRFSTNKENGTSIKEVIKDDIIENIIIEEIKEEIFFAIKTYKIDSELLEKINLSMNSLDNKIKSFSFIRVLDDLEFDL